VRLGFRSSETKKWIGGDRQAGSERVHGGANLTGERHSALDAVGKVAAGLGLSEVGRAAGYVAFSVRQTVPW
jgi:hypothetical protein